MPKNSLIFFLLFLWIVPDLSGQTLIAYYPFDNHTADLSGNNNDGYFYGGLKTTTDRFGNPCGALYFNGKDAFIQVPNSVSLKSPVKAITVTCWFKLDSPSLLKDKKWLTLVCKGKDFEESYLNPQYRVQVYQSPIQSTISINTDFTEYDSNFVKNSFPTGWNFFALVYDGKYVRTFLNKVQIWEFAYTKTFSPNDDPLFIGRDIPGNMEFFAGALDDLRIFNGALTGTEITNIYQKDIPAVSKKDPEILCPADITVNNDPGTCFAKVNFNKAAVDYDCGNLTVKQTEGLPSGSNFQIGESKLIFEIKNKNGIAKTCTTKIIVMDKEPPAFRCKEDTFILRTDSGVNGFYYTYSLPVAVDNCSPVTARLEQGIPSGSLFPEGQTLLKFVAYDQNNNSSECTYAVNVVDLNTDMIIDKRGCPPDIERYNEPGKCGAVVNYNLPADSEYKSKAQNETNRFYPVGTTRKIFQRSTGYNILMECSFNITVIDNEIPVLECPADQVIYCLPNERSSPIFYATPEAKDNCGIESVVLLSGQQSGMRLTAGIYSIVHKATDYYGNSAICTFKITVLDTNNIKAETVNERQEKTVTKSYISDKVKYDYDLKFNQCVLTLLLYDDGEEDNDTVSVFFNGVEIVNREMIRLKDHGTIVRTVVLVSGERNDFIVKAWNNGRISPNTIKIEFYEGTRSKFSRKKPKKSRVLHSRPGVAGAISIRCNGK